MPTTQFGQTVKTDVPCCLTDSREARVIASVDRHGKPLQTVISTESGLVFTDPRPTPEQVRRFYSEEYRLQYKQVATPKLKHVLRAGRLARRRMAAISDRLHTGCQVLDAGSGGGEFVHTMRSTGYDAQGIEPNEGYAKYSINEYGLKVYNGFYQDAPFQSEQFDCVTMFHVLEHLEQPVEAVRLLANWLRPGGTLVIEVPNVDCLDTAPGQQWHLGHLYNFSQATLAAVGMRAGLELVRIKAGGVLFGVFEKPASGATRQEDLSSVLDGAFNRTYALLSKHTPLRHFSRPHVPLLRVYGKTRRALDENRVVKSYEGLGARSLMEDLGKGKVA